MCLDLNKNSKIRVASRNIKVYKALEQGYREFAYSPFYLSRWKIGETKKVKSFSNLHGVRFKTSERKMKARHRWSGYGQVNAGLHSYGSKYDVPHYRKVAGQVYAATIPKGTLYIRGTDGEIVSLALRIDEKVVDKPKRK